MALGLGLVTFLFGLSANVALAQTATEEPPVDTSAPVVTPPADVPVVVPVDETPPPAEPEVTTPPPPVTEPTPVDEAYAPPPETSTPNPAPAPTTSTPTVATPAGGANPVPAAKSLGNGPDNPAIAVTVVTDKPDAHPAPVMAPTPSVAAGTAVAGTRGLAGPDKAIPAFPDGVTTLTVSEAGRDSAAAVAKAAAQAPVATLHTLNLRGDRTSLVIGATSHPNGKAVSPSQPPVTAREILEAPMPTVPSDSSISAPAFGVGSSHGPSGILEMLASYVFPGASNTSGGAILLLFPLALLLAALTPRVPRLHLQTLVAESGAGCPGFNPVQQRPG